MSNSVDTLIEQHEDSLRVLAKQYRYDPDKVLLEYHTRLSMSRHAQTGRVSYSSAHKVYLGLREYYHMLAAASKEEGAK